jgi:hypothetical protein
MRFALDGRMQNVEFVWDASLKSVSHQLRAQRQYKSKSASALLSYFI